MADVKRVLICRAQIYDYTTWLARALEALLETVVQWRPDGFLKKLVLLRVLRRSSACGAPAGQIWRTHRGGTGRPAKRGLAHAGRARIPARTSLDLAPAPMPLVAQRRAVAVERRSRAARKQHNYGGQSDRHVTPLRYRLNALAPLTLSYCRLNGIWTVGSRHEWRLRVKPRASCHASQDCYLRIGGPVAGGGVGDFGEMARVIHPFHPSARCSASNSL